MFWDDYLRSIGWRQGAPRRGAVAVTDFGWAGHVAVVEEVTEAGVVVSEMNYTGFNQIDTRLVSPDEFVYLY